MAEHAHNRPAPKALPATPSRRTVTLAALLAPFAGLVAHRPAQAHPAAWAEALPALTAIHRNGRTAALAAIAHGLDPSNMFCVMLDCPNAPRLLFGKGNAPGFTVSGDGSVR